MFGLCGSVDFRVALFRLVDIPILKSPLPDFLDLWMFWFLDAGLWDLQVGVFLDLRIRDVLFLITMGCWIWDVLFAVFALVYFLPGEALISGVELVCACWLCLWGDIRILLILGFAFNFAASRAHCRASLAGLGASWAHFGAS